MKLEDYIASIENYPKEGVTFRDISPLMADGNAYSYAIREIVQYATDKKRVVSSLVVQLLLNLVLVLLLFVNLVNCHVK